jgi:hypothetical protein
MSPSLFSIHPCLTQHFTRLTHGPPARIFDITRTSDFAGCEALRARLPELQPRLHIFGHIHEARGAHIHSWKSQTHATEQGEGEEAKDDGMPVIQNEYSERHEDDTGSEEGEGQGHCGDGEVNYAEEGQEDVKRTVFVNAANLSSPGLGIPRRGNKPPPKPTLTGGPGFQPIVVDLKD